LKRIFLQWPNFINFRYYTCWDVAKHRVLAQLVHLNEWKISDTRYTEKSSGARIYRVRTNGQDRMGRKRRTEDVELQRRQIPYAQQNGQSYALITHLSLFRVLIQRLLMIDDVLSLKSTKSWDSVFCCIWLKQG